ncbi:MAG: hypothetical protein WDW38_007505 [Sanguina aurantia]
MEEQREQQRQLVVHKSVRARCLDAFGAAHTARTKADMDMHGEPLKGMGTSCPAGLGVISGCVFGMLAAAVPNLVEISLYGHCWDAALYAFGVSCPLMATLEIDPLRVPVQALRELGNNLPSLTSLRLTTNKLDNDDKLALGVYVDAVMLEVRRCSKLATLYFEFGNNPTLTCKPESWERLPATLVHFACSDVTSSAAFQSAIRRIPSLHLDVPPIWDLRELFQGFPLLRQLQTDDTEPPTLVCSDGADHPSGRRSLVKKRILEGKFILIAFELALQGTCEEVGELLAWLPNFTEVASVAITFQGGALVPCLQRLSHSFSDLKYLDLDGRVEPSDQPGMDVGFFAPLAQLTQLDTLTVSCDNMTLTEDGLVQLCMTLHALTSLTICKGEGLEKESLEAALLAGVGREISVDCD